LCTYSTLSFSAILPLNQFNFPQVRRAIFSSIENFSTTAVNPGHDYLNDNFERKIISTTTTILAEVNEDRHFRMNLLMPDEVRRASSEIRTMQGPNVLIPSAGISIKSSCSSYRAYGLRERMVRQGGLLVRSVFKMTGTLVISLTS